MTNPATMMTTNELPTPRTDELTRSFTADAQNMPGDLADFARQLERETLTLSADCAAMREALQKVKLVAHRVDDAGGSTWQCGIIADAALSTTAGTELLARLERAEKERDEAKDVQCVGNGTKGCGFKGGQSGLACPECGGMLLSAKSRLEAAGTTIEWLGGFAESFKQQRDAAIERVKVLEAELAKKSD